MKNYILTLKTDQSHFRIKTPATDKETAKEIVMKAEGCAESAIIAVQEEILHPFRSFKIEHVQSTNHLPDRIRITDLRFNKTIIISYGPNTEDQQTARAIEFLNSLGINIAAHTWAENSQSQHLYAILLTDNFTIQIK